MEIFHCFGLRFAYLAALRQQKNQNSGSAKGKEGIKGKKSSPQDAKLVYQKDQGCARTIQGCARTTQGCARTTFCLFQL